MKIAELAAGRELDAFVAEKIMGWEVVGLDRDRTGWYGKPPGVQAVFRIPHYSTQISAAWEVVEKMKECSGVEWDIWVAALNGGAQLLRGNANGDAPRLIIRAARKVLGA